MRILIATDAWRPQVNGVVTTLARLETELVRRGVDVALLTPQRFARVPFPLYPGLSLAVPRNSIVEAAIRDFAPDWIHIATEGPVGWSVRHACLRCGRPFTTSYHTKFPEYANRLLGLPESWIYALARRFHDRSAGVMVATASLEAELRKHGFSRLMHWSRGVDCELFKPSPERPPNERPVFLYVGRVSREKNIETFLDAALPGDKLVVGDGPHLDALRRRYPSVTFTGRKEGAELSALYTSADVFVFPSRTDTFGLVVLEALASGLPVAAHRVTGPADVVEHGISGILSDDLAAAAIEALRLGRRAARARAEQFTWADSARQFLDNILLASAATRAVTAAPLPTASLPRSGRGPAPLDFEGRLP
jgi:glycosyltransferase involved in cell wall biosynthesis